MEPETSTDTHPLCFLKASWIRHNRSQDNATVLRSVFFRRLCAQKVKRVTTACVRGGVRGVGVETERVPGRYRQVISHPCRGAQAMDSAVLDSNDNGSFGCTRSLLPQGHRFSSACQRESSADSAQH
ncbi:hypothetical protein ABVT39_003039 [Epinephelus coioides]